MTYKQIALVTASALAMPALAPASAQGLRAVAPLPGYVCMEPNLTPEQETDQRVKVPFFDAPSRSAHEVGWAASVVLVRSPYQAKNGFLEALFPTGRTVWIKISALKPWRNPYVPSAQCVPSLMSNGRYGFDFH